MDTRFKPAPVDSMEANRPLPYPESTPKGLLCPSPALPVPFTDTPNRFVIGYGPCFGAQVLDAFITPTDKRDSNLFIAARHLYPIPWWSLRKLLSS